MLIIIAILFNGCSHHRLITAGQDIKIGTHMTVTPSIDWNKIEESDIDIWTLDGTSLQRILFIKGIYDGDDFIPLTNNRSPKFQKNMTYLEIIELFETAFSKLDYQKLNTSHIEPYKAKYTSGLRFKFNFSNKDGLEMLGDAYAVLNNDQLFMMIYYGTKIHYYYKGSFDFQQMLNSLRIKI